MNCTRVSLTCTMHWTRSKTEPANNYYFFLYPPKWSGPCPSHFFSSPPSPRKPKKSIPIWNQLSLFLQIRFDSLLSVNWVLSFSLNMRLKSNLAIFVSDWLRLFLLIIFELSLILVYVRNSNAINWFFLLFQAIVSSTWLNY